MRQERSENLLIEKWLMFFKIQKQAGSVVKLRGKLKTKRFVGGKR